MATKGLFRFVLQRQRESKPMLIRDIERFLRDHGLAPTTFGRLAASDPRLVFDMRNGREPRPCLRSRVEHFMNTFGETRHAG